MKLEYALTVAGIALAGLLGLAHLGASMDASIAGHTGGGASGQSPSAMVASREAASVDVMAKVAHAVTEPGTLARDVLRARPRVPSAVAEHFETWATDWYRAAGEDAAPQVTNAWTYLVENPPGPHTVRKYLDKTLRTAADPDLGFAVPMDELPAAMKAWRDVTDPDQHSTVVRALMDENLARLEAFALRYGRGLREHTDLWGPVADPLRFDLNDDVKRYRQWHANLVAARARRTLSKREAFRLFDESPGLDLPRFPGPGLFEKGLDEGVEHFPLVSNTARYWTFDHVPTWVDLGVFPVEVSTFTKSFDGAIRKIGDYARHDFAHIGAVRGRLAKPLLVARWGYVRGQIAAFDAKGAAPEVIRGLQKYVGEEMWEGPKSVQHNVGTAQLPRESKRLLTQWLLDFGKISGDQRMQIDAASTLHNLGAAPN